MNFICGDIENAKRVKGEDVKGQIIGRIIQALLKGLGLHKVFLSMLAWIETFFLFWQLHFSVESQAAYFLDRNKAESYYVVAYVCD